MSWPGLLAVCVVIMVAGCITINPDAAGSAITTKATPLQTPQNTPLPTQTWATVTQTAAPTPVPTVMRRITDGYWCRDRWMNIGKDPTYVKECYRFFDDWTYEWGYSPGRPMGKSLSCSGDPKAKCRYSVTATGQYQVEGGYFYTMSGDILIDPHDPPYFIYTKTGIP